jgi:hypothetical protein
MEEYRFIVGPAVAGFLVLFLVMAFFAADKIGNWSRTVADSSRPLRSLPWRFW